MSATTSDLRPAAEALPPQLPQWQKVSRPAGCFLFHHQAVALQLLNLATMTHRDGGIKKAGEEPRMGAGDNLHGYLGMAPAQSVDDLAGAAGMAEAMAADVVTDFHGSLIARIAGAAQALPGQFFAPSHWNFPKALLKIEGSRNPPCTTLIFRRHHSNPAKEMNHGRDVLLPV
jgi:hypothetical protein